MTSDSEVRPVISLARFKAAQVAAAALPHALTLDRRPPDCLLTVGVELVDGEPVVVALVTYERAHSVTFPRRIGTGGRHLVAVCVRSVGASGRPGGDAEPAGAASPSDVRRFV